ncbi:MAG: PAS domain S-box protein [Gammaproteobacteria bacterium]|nr:PAS domain S-box protein [Gammaproteobacteria bacterium]MBU1409177.1 PAS domain S-box protein [Gammaproteobacteria bacterium]MBU1531073.1 PAS domain S-box protein [Gammaproteobacteria bacterium]
MKLAALFRDMSIRRKLTLITFLSAGAALFFAALIATWHQWSVSHDDLEKITHSQAIIVASNSTSALLFNDPKSAGQNLEALSAFDNIEFAALYDRQGRPFATFVAAGREPPPFSALLEGEQIYTHTLPSTDPDEHTDSDTHADIDAEEHTHTHAGHALTENYLDVIHAIDVGRERIGTIYLRSSLSPIHQQMAWSVAVMAGSTLAGLGLALLLIMTLLPTITGPMAALVGLMGHVSSEKNYALRAESQGKDEVAMLGREFNDMLAQIQARDTTLAQHRAHLEQEVAQRTASLNETQHIAHLGSWEWDIVNDTLSWSDEVYRIFGLAPQQSEATYEAFMQFVHPDDRHRVEEGIRQALEQQGLTYSQDHRIQLPDGTVRHVHEQGEVSFDEGGRAIRMVGTVQDITEATLATEQIRKQQELTTQIIETIPLRVFWKDRDLRYQGCNTLFAKDAGLTHPDELTGRTDFDMGWKDQAETYRADDRLVMDSNTPKLSYDEPQTTPDGGEIWLRSSKVPLRNDANETIGLLGIYEDITGHKLAAQALEESERKFRAIVDATVDGILVTDVQTRKFVIANRAICDMLGYPMEEVYRLGLVDIHPAEALAGVQKTFERQLKGEIRMAQNMPVKRKDGSVFFADVSASPIVLEGRTYLVGAFHDVTERRQAEERIRESEARYRSIFEYANDIIFLLNSDGTFRSISPAVERVAGWKAEEWIGKPFMPLVHADDLADAGAAFQKALAGESIPSLRLRVATKSGEYFSADVSVTPLGHDLIMGIARDVSERQRAEAEIRKLNEELESKVQERTRQLLEAQEDLVRKEKLAVLGQVAGSVGHELRNPLGVMNNAVYFLQTVLSDADETTKEYLNIIKDEIADSERIVSDLLDSVRTKQPRPEAVGVETLIGQTLRKCTIPASVTVTLDIPQTLPPLQVDAQQIQQVFRNLISNGAEAMPEGGELKIRAVENKPEGQVVISVRDTGTGIAPDILPRLFQPLFTTKARGIGLGLVVVKNLTQANGGTLTVQSEVGQGTMFTVTLPAARSFVEED